MASSQRSEEVDEVLTLLLREPDAVAAIVEIHQFAQGGRGAIGEIRSARRQSAELLHDDGADVVAEAGNERATGILRVDDAAQKRMRPHLGLAGDLEERQLRLRLVPWVQRHFR